MDEETPKSTRHWDPDHALEALVAERSVTDVDLTDASAVSEAVRQIFRENAQVSALAIVHIALHDPSAKVRLDASKYVIEHATVAEGGDSDPLQIMVKEIYAELEKH